MLFHVNQSLLWRPKECNSILRNTSDQKSLPYPFLIVFLTHTRQPLTLKMMTQKEREPWLVWLSGLSMGCKSKGRQFYLQSGHMPGFQGSSPVGGAREATTHRCFSPSLSPSPSLEINKYNL